MAAWNAIDDARHEARRLARGQAADLLKTVEWDA